ncbi:hypothetical protein [Rufibacter quisquiliarum]|uniref:Uncharacterized protein n=1 Tax=Rufibacter quisquiliarum TaxID=1549639 RepID=A0A839GS58_9BACT|nr:hypothetical protein [Rufibacter quisquiliarum]MBA9078335.1 hypothetical protein [Rufibacter quisquiliarum]
MNKEKTGTEAARKIRQLERKHFDKAQFCQQHNMKLDEIKHREIAEALNEAAWAVEDAFKLGYVSPKEPERSAP